MNILILHRIPYHRINYHLSIDHDLHQVTYIGLPDQLANLPGHIRYRTLTRAGLGSLADEVLSAIESEKLAVDAVIALSESELSDAARVREVLGVPGAGVSEIRNWRDKSVLKQLAVEHGLRVPRRMPLDRFALLNSLPWSGQTVLQALDPKCGDASAVFGNADEILTAMHQKKTGLAALDKTRAQLDSFELEELISGQHMHFDGLVENGQIIVMTGSQYIGNCKLYAQGQPIGSVQVETSADDALWAQKLIRAAGIQRGAFHIELISTPAGRVFLDLDNRPGGACVVETFRMATGINLIAAELSILLGEQINVKIRRKSKRFGWFAFPGHHLKPGTCVISAHHAFLTHPIMLRCEMLNKSSPLPRAVTYQPSALPMSGIIGAASSIEMANLLKKMFREVKIESVCKNIA